TARTVARATTGLRMLEGPLATISSDVRAGGTTVTTTVLVAPPAVALMVTGGDCSTGATRTVKEALGVPAGTVIVAGTAATRVMLLDNDAAVPPAGAGPERANIAVMVGLPSCGCVLKEVMIGD